MASSITSAGVASGMDFESIIAAQVKAKSSSINKNVTVKKETTNLEVSGVGKLKNALTNFQKALQALTEDNGFNTRKVTTDLPTENPFFSVTTNGEAANGEFDITVEQLAKSDKLTTSIENAKDKTFTAGKLTIELPDLVKEDGTKSPRKFEIEISDDDNIDSIRKKINNNDFGVTASTITYSDDQGKTYTKLVIDSGVSGKDSNIKMSFADKNPGQAVDPSKKIDSKDLFNVDTNGQTGNTVGKWDFTNGQNAIIKVDGNKLESSTNEFRNSVSGLTINALRLSKTEEIKKPDGSTTTGFVSNKVTISADTDAVTEKMQNFVTAYNSLLETMDGLYKHNTYTDGKNNYDGGELSGDSMLRSLKNQIQEMMTNVQANSAGIDIYSMGIKFDKDGVMSLDTTKFKDNINDNFNALVNLFSGVEDKDNKGNVKNGVLVRMDHMLEDYTKSGGILDKRKDALNEQLKQLQAKEDQNAQYLQSYEDNLRKRYARLDATMANYNNSLNYLYAALG